MKQIKWRWQVAQYIYLHIQIYIDWIQICMFVRFSVIFLCFRWLNIRIWILLRTFSSHSWLFGFFFVKYSYSISVCSSVNGTYHSAKGISLKDWWYSFYDQFHIFYEKWPSLWQKSINRYLFSRCSFNVIISFFNGEFAKN